MKGKKGLNSRASAEGRLWKVSIHPEQPPDVERVDEDMINEIARSTREYAANMMKKKREREE
jgi:hypothetical protein